MARMVARVAAAALLLTAGATAADPITSQMRRDDPRLAQRVSLTRPRLYVAELLAELSRQTGVELVAGDVGDGAGDEQVTAILRDVPLADALDALWSLVSYRGAEWHWQRLGKEGSYRYRLLRPRAAQLLAAQMRQRIQTDFEAHAAAMLAGAFADDRTRAKMEARDPALRGLVESERLRAGLRLFAETLPPETRLAVLRREARPYVRGSDLSPTGQAFIRFLWDQATRLPTGERLPIPEPTVVFFFVEWFPNEIAPSLYIMPDGIGGYAYIGGVPYERVWQERIGEEWLLHGDRRNDRAGTRRIEAPDPPPPPKPEDATPAGRMAQLADAAGISILARLPFHHERDPGAPFGQTVEQYLATLTEKLPAYLHKWRRGILVVTYANWFVSEADLPNVPWELVQQLREAERRQDGFLRLDDLVAAAMRLTERQLLRLAQEFRVMASVAAWRSVLRVCANSPENLSRLRSRQGFPIAPVAEAVRALGHPNLIQCLESGRAVALRVVEREYPDQRPPERSVMFQLLSERGEVLAAMGFRYQQRSTEKPTD